MAKKTPDSFLDVRDLKELNRLFEQAMLKKDGTWLQKTCTPDFIFSHATGIVQNKEQWIASQTSFHSVFKKRTTREIDVEMHCSMALVSGVVAVRQHLPEQKLTRNYEVSYLRVYLKSRGIWRIACHRSIGKKEL